MKVWQTVKEKLRTDKRLQVLTLLFAAGVALFLLSGGEKRKETSAAAANEIEICASVEQTLEARVTKLLSSVEGVGKVKVLVTVERLQEYAYAQNTAGSAERTENDYVIVEQNGTKNGLPLTVTAPVVRGVAVSCEGGGSARVRQEVVNLVCAALGVGASRVYVSRLAQ